MFQRREALESQHTYYAPTLHGLRLVDGNYLTVPTSTLSDGTMVLPSAVLGLELHLKRTAMRFYNPVTQQYLLSHEEESTARQASEERVQRLAAKLREINIDPDAV